MLYRVLSVVTFIMLLFPLVLGIKYLLIKIQCKSLWMNIAIAVFMGWSLVDFCEAFYYSTFADYALEAFLEQGYSVMDIYRYMITGSITGIIGFLLRKRMERQSLMAQNNKSQQWREWLKTTK
ncbi:MAG: hypothetical protein ACOYVK_13680 [Bacillota bacterium]